MKAELTCSTPLGCDSCRLRVASFRCTFLCCAPVSGSPESPPSQLHGLTIHIPVGDALRLPLPVAEPWQEKQSDHKYSALHMVHVVNSHVLNLNGQLQRKNTIKNQSPE